AASPAAARPGLRDYLHADKYKFGIARRRRGHRDLGNIVAFFEIRTVNTQAHALHDAGCGTRWTIDEAEPGGIGHDRGFVVKHAAAGVHNVEAEDVVRGAEFQDQRADVELWRRIRRAAGENES